MKKQLNQVRDFHNAMSQPVLVKPVIPEAGRAALRIKLILEEAHEFAEAVAAGDLVECADALTDLQYVLLGAIHEFGLGTAFEKLFNEVQRSNMSKLDENGKPIYNADGKVLKGPNYSPPNLKAIVEYYQQRTTTYAIEKAITLPGFDRIAFKPGWNIKLSVGEGWVVTNEDGARKCILTDFWIEKLIANNWVKPIN